MDQLNSHMFPNSSWTERLAQEHSATHTTGPGSYCPHIIDFTVKCCHLFTADIATRRSVLVYSQTNYACHKTASVEAVTVIIGVASYFWQMLNGWVHFDLAG